MLTISDKLRKFNNGGKLAEIKILLAKIMINCPEILLQSETNNPSRRLLFGRPFQGYSSVQ